VLDLRDPACAPGVIARVDREPGLRARRAADFVRMTQDFWIHDSGVGAVLAFGALLSLAIGMVIIGQALRSITRSHLRELCTLKAIGATGPELAGFVAWQAIFVAAAGGLMAGLLSAAIRRLLQGFGLEVVLSLPVLAAGAGAVAVMCLFASAGSLRVVLALQPAEVLK